MAAADDAPFWNRVVALDSGTKSVIDRLEDYVAMGVENVWLIDPSARRGYVYRDGFSLAKDGVLRTADSGIELPLASIFD